MVEPGEEARLLAQLERAAHKHDFDRDRADAPPSKPGYWYALHLSRRADLQIIPNLRELGLNPYYPMLRMQVRKPLRKLSYEQRRSGAVIMHLADVPLFPRLLFSEDVPKRALDVPGVVGILCRTDGKAALMPDWEVAHLRGLEKDGAIPGNTPAALIFGKGDRVRITGGHLTTFEGTVDRAPDATIERIDAKSRIRIMVEGLLGGSTAVNVTAGMIEKIEPPR